MLKDMFFNKALCIEFGEDSLTATCVKNTLKGVRISSSTTLPLNSGRDDEAVAGMKGFLLNNRINTERVFVCIPKSWAIVKFLSLPSVGRDKLSELIKYEIKRHIPFHIEDVFYDFHVSEGNGNNCNIILVTVPKEKVEYVREFLGRIPLQPQTITISSSADVCFHASGKGDFNINLIPHKSSILRGGISPLITRIAIFLILFLGISMFVSEIAYEKRFLKVIDEQLNKGRTEFKAAERSLAGLREIKRQRNFILNVKENNTSKLTVLAELTNIMPDDAWVSNIDYKDVEKNHGSSKGEIVITGLAASSSKLIPILEDSPLFENVEFVGPVTKSRGKEGFKIKAILVEDDSMVKKNAD